jgi:hypothetical protein
MCSEFWNCRCLDCLLNVMAHALKPDFVFRRNGRFHLNRRGRQYSRLLAAEVCAPAVVMLDTPCSEVEWRVLAAHSIRQFPLHFLSRASPCAITFQLESTYVCLIRTYFSVSRHRRDLACYCGKFRNSRCQMTSKFLPPENKIKMEYCLL